MAGTLPVTGLAEAHKIDYEKKTMRDQKTVRMVADGKDTVLELVEEVGHGSCVTVRRAQLVNYGDKKECRVKVEDWRRFVCRRCTKGGNDDGAAGYSMFIRSRPSISHVCASE